MAKRREAYYCEKHRRRHEWAERPAGLYQDLKPELRAQWDEASDWAYCQPFKRGAERAEALKRLRAMVKAGDTVSTVLRHRSRSGMMRHISLFVIDRTARPENGDAGMFDVSYLAALAMGDKRADDGGIKAGGCGMDMGFSLVYNLSSLMFPDGFTCAGRKARCSSNDHSNGDRRYTRHRHESGGYALRHRWL